MIRHVHRFAAVLLALVVAVVWLASPAQAKEPHPVVQLAKKLAEPVDFPGIDDPKTTLQEVLALLSEKFGVRFDINDRAFQLEMGGAAAAASAAPRGRTDISLVATDDKPASPGKPGAADKPAPPGKPAPPPPPAANGPQGEVGSTPVAERPIPKMTRVRLATVLKKILDRVPSASGATYILRRDGIEITTEAAKIAEFRNPSDHAPPIQDPMMDAPMGPPNPLTLVQAEFDKRPLDEALNELADATDSNVILDVRASDKVKPVTASLINVPLDTAVELLANMAGLQVVSRDRVLYVTTKDNAEAMHKELKARIKPAVNPVPTTPGVPPTLIPGLGGQPTPP
jgi:hypothetical protein